MTTENPNIIKLAWNETLADIKLSSPTAIVLTIGTSVLTLGATFAFTHSVAISAICGIALLLLVGSVVFFLKLFLIPRRLLKSVIEELNVLKDTDKQDAVISLAPHDVGLFKKFTSLITSSDLSWIGGFHFGDHIPRAALTSIREFYVEWDKPQHTFISAEMNDRFDQVKVAAQAFMTSVVTNTMPSKIRPDCLTVRTDTDPFGHSERTLAEVKEMNDAATHFVEVIIAFHHFALKQGFTFD